MILFAAGMLTGALLALVLALAMAAGDADRKAAELRRQDMLAKYRRGQR